MIGAVHKREPSFLLLLMLTMMLMLLLLLANITESHSDTTYSSVPHKCLAGCRKSGPVLPCSRKHGGWGEKGACIHAWPCHAIVLHLFPHQQKIVPARVSPGIFAACEARCGGSVAPSRTSSWQQQQQKTLACARRLWAAQHVQCGLFCTAPLAGASRMPGTVHHSTTYNSLCVASSSPRLPPLPPLPSPRCCWFADTRAGKGSDSCLTRSPALAERERECTQGVSWLRKASAPDSDPYLVIQIIVITHTHT